MSMWAHVPTNEHRGLQPINQLTALVQREAEMKYKLQTASRRSQIITMLVVSMGNVFNVATYLLAEATNEKSLDVLEQSSLLLA